ncbi:hypothetical protein GJ744_012253 [Endocarpon pusillum]|uniref:Uncharacterized protein n=1 Tax=Endocarpon pusillum TaxID=364733 RepID=A0A8H7AE36_9EURO|nr:hypothetical protein GJ744_012253 [Endocarpon pusillum]
MSPATPSNVIATPGRAPGAPFPKRKTLSFKIRAETREPHCPPGEKLRQNTYPVYRLSWEKLKAFLENKFPKQSFEERRVQNDHYIFDVPEDLTSEDHAKIEQELDSGIVDRAQSPEPK